MTTITLLPHAEKVAPPDAVAGYEGAPLLYHQVRTLNGLREGAPLVMNTYPTGTGKTKAALLRLLDLQRTGGSALVIAPTNALIDQHATDAQAFVDQNRLSFRVIKVTAPALRALNSDLRRGEALQRLITNPLTFWEELGLPADAEKTPVVVVTNPDIFYYALYMQYGHIDQRNVFAAIMSRFAYVIIDEFHYYDSKQFANFLFFFSLWKLWGHFEHQRAICLLSATPNDHVYTYLDRVFGRGTWAHIDPNNEPTESANLEVTPVLTELRMTVALVVSHSDSEELIKSVRLIFEAKT